MRYLILFSGMALAFLLTACSAPKTQESTKNSAGLSESSDPSRYQHERDFAPLKKIDADNIADAVPKIEPIKAAGNKSPYMVFGKVYHVMPDAKVIRSKGKHRGMA